MMYKRNELMKIVAVSIVFLFLISGLSAMTNGTQISNNSTKHLSENQLFYSQIPKKLSKPIVNINQPVNPYNFYSSEPAPMGIADYGLGPNDQPYAYETTAFLGLINVNNLETYNASLNQSAYWMSFQLNVNLIFENGNTQYAYWIQDVAHVNTLDNYVQFIDNIWNDSSFSSSVYNGTISGNGTSGTGFYYDWANQYLSGNDIYLSYPYNIQFKVFSYINAQGYPAVDFLYNDGYGWVTYDNANFIFASDLTSYPEFLVDGYQYEPDGNYYDAELILGGPWSGYQTYDVSSSLTLQLEYWNGNNFQEITNAYDFGSHTAEGISNVNVMQSYYPENGSFSTYITNGTGTLGILYQSNELSYLELNLPINSGVLYVNNTPYSFYNYGIYIPIFPSSYQTNNGWHSGYYTLYLYNDLGQLLWETNVNLIENQTLIIPLYNVTFSEQGLPHGSGWWVNITNGLSYFSKNDTINFLETNGTFIYCISSMNKDYYSTGGSFTVNVNNIFINVQFLLKTYSIFFIETGLPSGTTWSVTLNGNTLSSNTNSIIFTMPNGSYFYSILSPISGGTDIQYATYNINGLITVNGGNLNLNILYIKQYYLSMIISPSDSGYTIPNSGWYNSSTNLNIKAVPNNNFEFVSWSGTGNGSYSGTNNPVSITINGPITETANFIELYQVMFVESGLPNGTAWYVNLSNGQSFSSTTNTIIFNEPNGSYTYSISTINKEYALTQPTGSFKVNGANVNIAIPFYLVTFSITFKESGLLSGTSWFITLNGITHNSTTNTIAFTEPNGSYSYTIETPISAGTGIQYVVSQSKGTLTVNGADININVPYTTQYYLTMIASPSNGGTVSPSSGWYNVGSSVTIDAISNSNFEFVSWSGTGNGSYSGTNNPVSITINGPITETANFIELYQVMFVESGLPNGTAWYVNLSNGQSYNTTGNSIEIQIPNGSYSYMIATTNKEYSAQGGSLIVNGANLEISIKFNLVTYAITFTESGLSSGTSWSVTLNNIEKSSTNGTIIFNEPNGTYSYIISGISGYRSNTYSGTINVNGNPVSNSITWAIITYPITITENGIPNGTSWSATLTGTTFNGQYINVTLSSDTNTIIFNEPNGSYSYIIHLPSGYQSNNAKGSVNVSGNSAIATFKAQQKTNYLWIGIIAVVIIIAIVIGVILLRRGKNKQGVKEWKEPPKQN